MVMAKAANAKVVEDFKAMFKDYTDMIFKEKTSDLSESQPTKGNIRGGLTTIEEKALGNIEKLGKKTKFVGCLKPAEAPSGKGMWFMDTSSAAAEAVTLWAASGAVVRIVSRIFSRIARISGENVAIYSSMFSALRICFNKRS